MTIAVTTPTGNMGSHVVRNLCQAGTALVSTRPSSLAGLAMTHLRSALS